MHLHTLVSKSTVDSRLVMSNTSIHYHLVLVIRMTLVSAASQRPSDPVEYYAWAWQAGRGAPQRHLLCPKL
jgi:hypothetical protein